MLLVLVAGCASSPGTSEEFTGLKSGDFYGGNSQTIPARYSFAVFGPLKDRKIIEKYVPRYPRWAEEKGLEADVVLHFEVRPDGLVGKIEPEKQGDLEALAEKALRAFVFEPLPDDQPQVKQQGVMIFHFRLAGKE